MPNGCPRHMGINRTSELRLRILAGTTHAPHPLLTLLHNSSR
jgi:hypothetical protein